MNNFRLTQDFRILQELKRKFQAILKSQTYHDVQDGWLGIDSDTDPTEGADAGYVWVRPTSETATPIQAVAQNTRTEFPDMKVRLAQNPGTRRWEIVRVHDDETERYGDYIATLNQPLRQADMLYDERVYMERLTNLRMYPSDGLTLAVEPGYYRKPDGTWVGFDGDTIDLTSSVPVTVDEKRLVLVGITYSTGALTLDAQTPVSQYTVPRDKKLFELSDVATALNAASSDVKWLGAIPLIYGQTHLKWLFQYTALGYVAESLAGQYVAKSGDTMTGQLFIDGSADEIQLLVQGHSIQASNIFVVEDSAGVDFVTVTGTGNVGIGITTPTDKLYVQSATNDGMRIETTGVNTVPSLYLENDAQEWQLLTDGADNDNFKLTDVTGATTPIEIEPGADSLSFYMDASGTTCFGDTPASLDTFLSVRGARINDNANARGVFLAPDIDSSANGFAGIGYSPVIRAGASILAAYGTIGVVTVGEDTGGTSYNITKVHAQFARMDLGSSYTGTITVANGMTIEKFNKSTSGTMTTIQGIEIANQTDHTTRARAIRGLMNAGTNKHGLYFDGTAVNYLNGPLRMFSNSTTIGTSVGLEMSGVTKVLKVNNVTNAEEGSLTGENGMLIYNSNTGKIRGYAGGAWVDLH